MEINPEHFFDARVHKPVKGQILAKYTAVAEFVGREGKEQIMKLITLNYAYQAVAIMKRKHGAREPDCYRICREIAEDMIGGLTFDEIINKPYRFVIECLFYAERQYVPVDDPHWSTIPIISLNEETTTMKSEICI